jgi:hypothetical protein
VIVIIVSAGGVWGCRDVGLWGSGFGRRVEVEG